MKLSSSVFIATCMLCAALVFTGCSSSRPAYEGAFNKQNSLVNNQRIYPQPSEAIFTLTKQLFIQQGFTVEYADNASGVIKAVRNMTEKDDADISYNIAASADISKLMNETSISLAASQQTTLHRSTTIWWHLFGFIPFMYTGTEYQTMVTSEGNITTPAFYADFFSTLSASTAKYDAMMKIAAEKAEAERVEAESIAADKANAQRIEEARVKAAKAEAEKLEIERMNKAKAAADMKAAAEKAQMERIMTERAVAAAKEAIRVAEETKKAEAAAARAKRTKKPAAATK